MFPATVHAVARASCTPSLEWLATDPSSVHQPPAPAQAHHMTYAQTHPHSFSLVTAFPHPLLVAAEARDPSPNVSCHAALAAWGVEAVADSLLGICLAVDEGHHHAICPKATHPRDSTATGMAEGKG